VALAGVVVVLVALVVVTLVRVAAVHSSAYISFLNRFLSVCLWAAIAPLTLSNNQIKSGVCLHCQHYFRFFFYSKFDTLAGGKVTSHTQQADHAMTR